MKWNKTRRWFAFVSLFALASCDSEEPTDKDAKPDSSQVEPDKDGPSAKPSPQDPTPEEPSPEDEEATTGEEEEEGTSTSTTGGEPEDGSSSEEPGTEDSSEDEKDSSDDGKIDCSALKVTGANIGQVPMNLELINAKGDKVSLHDYCNDVLYIAAATAY